MCRNGDGEEEKASIGADILTWSILLHRFLYKNQLAFYAMKEAAMLYEV